MILCNNRKKKQKSHTGDDTANHGTKVSQPSKAYFYYPTLAFQQVDDEEGIDEGREIESRSNDNLQDLNVGNNLHGKVKSTDTATHQSATQISPLASTSTIVPRISLAKILRERRDQARHLSSCGWDLDDTFPPTFAGSGSTTSSSVTESAAKNDAKKNDFDLDPINDICDGRWF